jgi:type VI secretion system protein ImpA
MTLMDDTPTANARRAPGSTPRGSAGRPTATPGRKRTTSSSATGAEALDDALAQEDETAEHGGLARPAARRRARAARAAARCRATRSGCARRAGARAPQPRDRAAGGRAGARALAARPLRAADADRARHGRGGLAAVAQPILEKADRRDRRAVAGEWEAGPLVAQPLALLCRVIDRLEDSTRGPRKELYLRVCRLDPLQAIALQRGA